MHYPMAADPLFPWLLFSDDPKGRAGKEMQEIREKEVEKEGERAELF